MLHWLLTNVNNSNPVGVIPLVLPRDARRVGIHHNFMGSAFCISCLARMESLLHDRTWGLLSTLERRFCSDSTSFHSCASPFTPRLFTRKTFSDSQRSAKRVEERGSRLVSKLRAIGKSIGLAIPEATPRQGSLAFGCWSFFWPRLAASESSTSSIQWEHAGSKAHGRLRNWIQRPSCRCFNNPNGSANRTSTCHSASAPTCLAMC